VRIDGKLKQPKTFDIDTLLKLRPLEDRGLSPSLRRGLEHGHSGSATRSRSFINQCDPLPSAKYVQFLSYYDRT